MRFIERFDKRVKKVDEELMLRVAMRSMSRLVGVLREVLRGGFKLRAQLQVGCLTPTGLSKADATKPAWAREATRWSKVAVRAKGVGRKSQLELLYRHVKECLGKQREHGHFVSRGGMASRFQRVCKA